MRETIWKKYVISAVTVCALGVMLHSNTVHAVVSDNEEVQEENYVKQHSWIVGLIGESEQDEKYSGGG